jgi:hypothetical protein
VEARVGRSSSSSGVRSSSSVSSRAGRSAAAAACRGPCSLFDTGLQPIAHTSIMRAARAARAGDPPRVPLNPPIQQPNRGQRVPLRNSTPKRDEAAVARRLPRTPWARQCAPGAGTAAPAAPRDARNATPSPVSPARPGPGAAASTAMRSSGRAPQPPPARHPGAAAAGPPSQRLKFWPPDRARLVARDFAPPVSHAPPVAAPHVTAVGPATSGPCCAL